MRAGRRQRPRDRRAARGFGIAAVVAVAAVVLWTVRGPRTGLEVGLIALSIALFTLAPRGSRRPALRLLGAGCIVAVVAIAVEPHVH